MVCGILVTCLPLLGIILGGRDPWPYLEMPPTTRIVEHVGFSWVWFAFFTATDLIMVTGLIIAVRCGLKRKPDPTHSKQLQKRFPWWGWAGILLCLTSWFLAWNRFTWFRLFQPHTFFPIWLGFILGINALAVRRCGRCLLLKQPSRFILLFPVSAAFWWVFEFFNRFVQNWWYQSGIENLGPWQYTFLASLAFSTVLPAVLSVIDLLSTCPALGNGLARCHPLSLPPSKKLSAAFLASGCIGLTLIGIFPDQLFALLWVSPLIIILSIQRFTDRSTLLHPLHYGDWRPVVIPALAALICGFFWEMWNSLSLARWSYTIPYVERFYLFEMPILGYGGYLPFGLECSLIGTFVTGSPFEQTA
jgi:hypothetical protein